MQAIKATYLLNSGFIVELPDTALIFDYYKDPKLNMKDVLLKYDSVYFFGSHAHPDHFNSRIALFKDKVKKYFMSFDIEDNGGQSLPAGKSVYLNCYDRYEDGAIEVETFSSTDEGISFLVTIGGWRIFHAGDFNWWHWKGDTKEMNDMAEKLFQEQMSRLKGLKADVAFFPVDDRLEEYWDCGAKEFCRRTELGYFIAMHNRYGCQWIPPEDFFAAGKQIPVWAPLTSGDSREITK